MSDQWRSQDTIDAGAEHWPITLYELLRKVQKHLGGGLGAAPPENYGILQPPRLALRQYRSRFQAKAVWTKKSVDEDKKIGELD